MIDNAPPAPGTTYRTDKLADLAHAKTLGAGPGRPKSSKPAYERTQEPGYDGSLEGSTKRAVEVIAIQSEHLLGNARNSFTDANFDQLERLARIIKMLKAGEPPRPLSEAELERIANGG